jgi:hypothetical protein
MFMASPYHWPNSVARPASPSAKTYLGVFLEMTPRKSRHRPRKNNEQLDASCRLLRPVNGVLLPVDDDSEHGGLQKKSSSGGHIFSGGDQKQKARRGQVCAPPMCATANPPARWPARFPTRSNHK